MRVRGWTPFEACNRRREEEDDGEGDGALWLHTLESKKPYGSRYSNHSRLSCFSWMKLFGLFLSHSSVMTKSNLSQYPCPSLAGDSPGSVHLHASVPQ